MTKALAVFVFAGNHLTRHSSESWNPFAVAWFLQLGKRSAPGFTARKAPGALRLPGLQKQHRLPNKLVIAAKAGMTGKSNSKPKRPMANHRPFRFHTSMTGRPRTRDQPISPVRSDSPR
ncbi:hypothetical protein [Lysobacter changpingensis]|uniref:hypothetical protein n=1 Tax=Lysobacter changpingensis TaxID=2792784 RepID=UPI001A906018|nr:hypothetical protein [Lysobacter changpingensis]